MATMLDALRGGWSNAFSIPTPTWDKRSPQQAELQEKIDAGNGLGPGRTVEMPWTRCAARRPRPVSTSCRAARSARVALCRLLASASPTLLPARRADQPSRCRVVAWLERHLAEFPGKTVVAVTMTLLPRTTSARWDPRLDRGDGIPCGKATTRPWLKQKEQASPGREEKRRRAAAGTMQRELEWMGQSAQARRTKSKARIAAYQQMRRRGQAGDRSTSADCHSGGAPRLGDHVIRAEGSPRASAIAC